MDNITEKIKSLRETVGVKYKKPDPGKIPEFIHNLSRHPQALDYLHNRGLNDETIKHFNLGFDKERGAISIPIYKNGELVSCKYRLLDDEKLRYLTEPDCEVWVFNDDAIKEGLEKRWIVIVEGEFDCMMMWQRGVKNCISPSSGKDSFGPWLGELEKVQRVYIAYDNDVGGKSSAVKLAERLGVERCMETTYPSGKDATEYLLSIPEGLGGLLKNSKPFTRREFKNLGDVITSLRNGDKADLKSSFVPSVDFKSGWMAVVSGRSNVGKTAYVLNIADELTKNGVPTLILPFERGIESVGERFLSVMSGMKLDNPNTDWDGLVKEASTRPLFFAMPTKDQTTEFIVKAHRFFDVKVVIIDHLDYMVRQVTSSRGDAIADTMQQLKRVAEDNGIILLVVSHVRKIEAPGQFIARAKKPNIEDLKGSSSLYQDPEVVVMLSQTLEEGQILVDVIKNKGIMGEALYNFDLITGKFKPLGALLDTNDEWNGF